MTTSSLRAALLLPALAIPLFAQSNIDPPLQRLVRAWPTAPPFQPGPMHDLAVGAFVPGHPGQCAVVLRQGELFLQYQPMKFDHCTRAGALSLRRIETLPGRDGAPDRLVAVSAQGLHVLALTPAGFADANAGPDAAWAACQELDAAVLGSGASATAWVLGANAGAFALASVDDAGTVTTSLVMPAPPGMVVRDACLVDWVAGGDPEIALQTSHGLALFAANGAALLTVPGSHDAARIAALPGPAIVRVLQAAGSWNLDTVFADRVESGGTLPLTRPPRGLAVLDANADAWPDVLVSTDDSVRHLLLGSVDGPTTDPATDVVIHDVDPLPVGENLAAPVVADVDDDGDDDLVVAQGAADSLVLIASFGPQLQALVWNSTPPAADELLAVEEVLGFDGVPGEGWPATWTGAGGLGVGFALPPSWASPWTASKVLLLSVYLVDMGATASVDDPVLLAPKNYEYTLGNSGWTVADVLVPFDPSAEDVTRYVIEARIVDKTAGGYTNSTPPRFLDVGFKPDVAVPPTFDELMAMLTTEHEIGWWWDWADFTSLATFHPGAPPAGKLPETTPPGNRFVGLMDVPRPHKTKKGAGQVPSVGATVSLGGASGH